MLVILEGVDGTFKSTVALGLSDNIGLPVVRGSSFESAKQPNKELFRWYLEKIAGGESIIFDRYVYSNRVYAQLYRGYSIISVEQLKLLEQIIQQLHDYVLIVYLTGEEDDIGQRLNVRGDNYIKRNEIKSIMRRYEDVLNTETGFRVNLVNTSKLDSEQIIKFLSQKIRRENESWPR